MADSYQRWLEEEERKRLQKPDLVFVCPKCGLKMPWVPFKCPRCGGSLSRVRSCYVTIEESVKLAEELENLLLKVDVPSGRIGGKACQVAK